MFGAEVEIIDDQHRPVVAGTVGAIRYRGGSVAESYYRNPEESATAFRDGWYYPGDLGRFDTDGFLYLTGRSKDMIIRGGVNIYPAEIEQTLATHPAVAEAAVVAWPSQERGEEVAAFVVCRTLGPSRISSHIAADRWRLTRFREGYSSSTNCPRAGWARCSSRRWCSVCRSWRDRSGAFKDFASGSGIFGRLPIDQRDRAVGGRGEHCLNRETGFEPIKWTVHQVSDHANAFGVV